MHFRLYYHENVEIESHMESQNLSRPLLHLSFGVRKKFLQEVATCSMTTKYRQPWLVTGWEVPTLSPDVSSAPSLISRGILGKLSDLHQFLHL